MKFLELFALGGVVILKVSAEIIVHQLAKLLKPLPWVNGNTRLHLPSQGPQNFQPRYFPCIMSSDISQVHEICFTPPHSVLESTASHHHSWVLSPG